jgi:Alkaline and neutral invertase
MPLLDEVYLAAVRSLRTCCHEYGLTASGRRYGHSQVWARDSMIALLGGSLVEDEQIRSALVASVHTLGSKQSSSGCIPNNVDTTSGKPNFRAYADGGLWWLIGARILAADDIHGVLDWYQHQDVDQRGLLSMQEGCDWQDLFCTRGKGLYLNCLYVLALDMAGHAERAHDVRTKINDYFWYCGDGDMLRHVRHTFSTESLQQQDSLGRRRWLPVKKHLIRERYYLPYLGFRVAGEWFDALGHMLAILAGVADSEKTEIILDCIERHEAAEFPMRALFPPVQEGDPDWREYYGMLNLPHRYHNGGIWPFLGGFYVAALIKAGRPREAEGALRRLAKLNLAGEFNEWHHGETAEPMGVHDQAWSAGMYIYAYECFRRGEVIHFKVQDDEWSNAG